MSQFLADETATHLLFLDADIGFEPEQVLRLIAVRRRHVRGRLSDQAHRLGAGEAQHRSRAPDPAAAALRYVFEVENPDARDREGGFIKVRYAGTGFLMIRRGAVEAMCARYPELQYKRDHSVDDGDGERQALCAV